MSRRTTAVRTLLAAPALGVAAVAVLSPVTASADPTPDAAISTAVTTSPAVAGVPAGDYTVTDVRVAGSDPAWAAAALEPTLAGAATLDPATVVLQQVDGTWQVVDLGTARVGCGLVTPAVQGDHALLC
jgi:hypothetical protein